MMIKTVVCCCLILAACAFTIETNTGQTSSRPFGGLQFTNKTDSNVTQDMIAFFNRACESAYAFYHENIRANL